MPVGSLNDKVKGAWDFLRKMHLGPFRFLFSDEHDALYLQAVQKAGKEALSLVKILRDGTILFGGPHKTLVCVGFNNEAEAGPVLIGAVSGAFSLPGQAGDMVGMTWKLKAVSWTLKAMAAVASIEVDLYKGGGGTVLAAPVVITAAGCPWNTQAGDVVDEAQVYSYTLHMALGAGGSITGLQTRLFFEATQAGQSLEHPGRLTL